MTAPLLAALAGACVLTMPAAGQEPEVRARQAYERAVELEKRGNQPAALSLLWEASGLAPRDPDLQNRLGEALAGIGALDAAVAAFRAALAARPEFPKASNNLVLALVKSGRGNEAVEVATRRLAAAPDDPDRYFALGLAQSEQNVSAAIDSFRKTLALRPAHNLARYNLAMVLNRADRMDEALAELRRALAIEPRGETHQLMGIIYWHQGDLDRAAEALHAAVKLEPAYADAFYTLGAVLKARRDWAGAADALRRAIALRPDPAAEYMLAQVLQQAGDGKTARNHFAEAERLRQARAQEQEATVWTSVGMQRLDAGELDAALDFFRRAAAVSERYAPAYYQMGRTLQRLGRETAARQAFARAAELNPSLVPPRAP